MNFLKSLQSLFEPAFAKELEEKSNFVSVKEGETILDFGQNIRVMPLILSGVVKISRRNEEGQELLLYYISPLETCAMTFTCCMERNTSEVKAVAEEDVEMLTIPISVMDDWMMRFPSWKNFIMKTIRTRFNELLKTIDQISFQKLDERLVHYLKEKSKATKSSLINLSHEQIAQDLATSRVVISRLLKKLEIDNKLLLYRHQIKLLRDL